MSLDLVQGAALMLALCWLLSVSARYWQGRPLGGQVITGVVFGGICAVGMLTPVVLIPGVLLDTRTVVIGMATLFGGPWVGGIAVLMTAGVRLWVGGAGMTAGILGLVLPLLLGLVFRAAESKGFVKRSARVFFVFGLLVQAGGLLLYTTQTPPETQPTLEIVLLFLGVLPVVTVLLGLLLKDIEDRTNTSAALQQSESRLRAIAAAVPDMLLVIDEDGRYLDVVSARRMPLYADFPGAPQWVGKRVEDVLPPEDAALFRGLVHRALRTSVPQLLEHSMQGADSLRTFEILANRLEYEHAGKQAAVLVMRDITMRRTAEEQIRTLALYDPLTGLPNRSFLLARLPLARRESARTRRFSALLSIDLDDFGSLNDTHGNLAGDRMLQRVAQCLLPVLPLGATPVRWGADEFVLLLEGLSANEEEAAADAARAAQNVVEAIALTAADDVLSYKVSACVGIALFRDAGESDNPMRRATLALYAAKDAGKGQIRIYDPVIQDAIVARLALEASIRH
ncbi:MAG: diguanylate cyclase, partial [Burkholderiaceae bacterium]|nr:diguanylate cyclase [Burkholderiaceae bacterium]